MGSVRRLLAVGNGKLGESIHHFDIPAVSTCPGRSSICAKSCYATKGRFRTKNVQEKFQWCLEQSQSSDFAERMNEEIRSRGVLVLRIHVSGDFNTPSYAKKWLKVMEMNPHVRFFFYTRSWRVPKIVSVIEEMAELPCSRVWYSVDAETGLPETIPEGVRLAYLQDCELASMDVDLRFLLRHLRTEENGRESLPLICPAETIEGKAENVNCANCGICWS